MRMLLPVMSMSGSVTLLMTFFLGLLFQKKGSFRLEMVWLKISLFCYLLPFPSLKMLFVGSISEQESESVERLGVEPIVRFLNEVPVPNTAFRVYASVSVAVLGVACLLGIRYFMRYRKFRGELFRMSLQTGCGQDVLDVLKKRLKLKEKISLYIGPEEMGAFTVGIFHPMIVIPAGMSADRREAVLLHELCHIRRRDSFFKLLTMAAVCLHWFNPIVYFLPKLYGRLCELCCDDMVIRNLERCKRKIYAEELLKQAVRNSRRLSHGMSFLGSRRHVTEERIMNIKEPKRWIGKKRLVGVALTGIMVFTAGIPVYAYEPVASEHFSEEAWVYNEEQMKNGMTGISSSFVVEEYNTDTIDYVKYDRQFMDEAGNIYNADTSVFRECEHSSTQDGIYQVHEKSKDGSCHLIKYAAVRCTECKTIISQTLLSDLYSKKCPH